MREERFYIAGQVRCQLFSKIAFELSRELFFITHQKNSPLFRICLLVYHDTMRSLSRSIKDGLESSLSYSRCIHIPSLILVDEQISRTLTCSIKVQSQDRKQDAYPSSCNTTGESRELVLARP